MEFREILIDLEIEIKEKTIADPADASYEPQ
jgi:hypothetical protein